MTRGSSINFKKSSASFEHNDRTEEREPKHLLPEEFRQENECDRSAIEAKLLLAEMIENAKKEYQERTGQKLQAKIFAVEAVINLEAHHTLKDVEKINEYLEQKHGFRAIQSSIHRDEGHINEEGKPEYNLHAHVVYCNLDKDGKTILKGLEKGDFRELQTFVANALEMQRGQSAEITKAKHKSPQEFRHEKTLASQKDLKAKLKQGVIPKNLHELYDKTKGMERLEIHKQMTAIVGKSDGVEVGHLTKMLELSENENKSIKEELKALKEAQKEERAQLKELGATRADYAVMEAKYKGLQAQIKGETIDPIKVFEEIEEMTKPIHALGDKELVKRDENGREIDPIDEMLKASTKKIEEKGIFTTTTKTVFDPDKFIAKVRERENEHQKIHKEKNALLKTLEYGKERMKDALKSVFSKFTGKTLGEVQKERTELLNVKKERIELQKEQQQKERGVARPKNRGIER
jgi:hypothetical protein